MNNDALVLQYLDYSADKLSGSAGSGVDGDDTKYGVHLLTVVLLSGEHVLSTPMATSQDLNVGKRAGLHPNSHFTPQTSIDGNR
ncbi:hypothetical protein EYZ11_009778 [Aspergillus tanneri]|uniref:Uncharacterized protein n=1 Tax=Aspergillus tanneri TaxID=1220188 RepID=A0A4V3UND5_9EURO|nr:hypothetical protein EYZ11_009778 [Aspergillus tanneri]